MNQEKIDEIEKVLRKHFDLTNPYFANIAREICKLFEAQPDEPAPMDMLKEELRLGMYHGEPDESRLLTDQEINHAIPFDESAPELLWDDLETNIFSKLIKAQDAKTARIAEQQGIDKGRREVVEFLIQNCHVQNTKETGAWQTKLKEWRIAGE